MGRAGTYTDVTGNPQTCCTNCRTVFEVSPELLSSSDTRVRCGECLSIFDALANLRDPDEGELPPLPESPGPPGQSGPSAESGPAPRPTPETSPAIVAHASLAGLANDTGALDVTYSDFDLFSGEAELPEVAYLDETTDTPEFDFDTVDVDEDETFSDTLFAHDATIEPGAASPSDPLAVDTAFLVDESPPEPLVFDYRDADPEPVVESVSRAFDAASPPETDGVPDAAARGAEVAPAPSAAPPAPSAAPPSAPSDVPAFAVVAPPDEPTPFDEPPPFDDVGLERSSEGGGSWALRSLMVLLLAALAFGLYAYRERDRAFNDPLLRPLLLLRCELLGCTVPSRIDLAALQIRDKNAYSHPTRSQALVINVTLQNTAAFEQRYPQLVVRLLDSVGRTVAERDFEPELYLRGNWAAGDTIAAGRRLEISLEVSDPGQGAENYEFELRAGEA